MTVFTFRFLLALIGFLAFLALLAATVFLAKNGQAVGAAFTGSGAAVVGVGGLFKFLSGLAQ